MVYFLFGSNTYSSRGRLKEIMAQFSSANPDFLMFRYAFDSEPDGFLERFASEFFSQGLFQERKIFIFDQVLAVLSDATAKGILEMLGDSKVGADQSVLIIFHEGEIKKSIHKSLVSFLLRKPCIAKEFGGMNPAEFRKFLRQESEERGIRLDSYLMRFLEFFLKNDPWKLRHTLDKLEAALHAGMKLNDDTLYLLFPSLEEAGAFDLVDALATKQKSRALELLAVWSEDLAKALPLVLWQFRILMKVKHLPAGTRLRDVHPYVLQKSLKASRYFSSDELRSVWEALYKAEIGLREGRPDVPFVFDRILLQ